MTTRFFPGFHDPDADRLNTLLDAMRSGMRAPDPASTSEEAEDLAVTASQFRTLDAGARVAAGATDTTFDSIWEDMMSAYAVTNLTPLANDSPGREERIHQRVIPVPPRPTFGWWNGLLSAAIVTLMIAGLIAAAWALRETGGNGTGDDIRLAATALDGTPENDENNPWVQPISAEDCVEPYANSTLATTGVYQPASTPASSDAEAVAEAARLYEACGSGDISQERLPIRDRWQVYFNTNVSPSPNSARDVMVQHQLDIARELSPLLPSQNPADYIHTTNADLELNPELIFLPSQAIQLGDGRIAIPMSYLIPLSEDSTPTDLYPPWPSTAATDLAIEIQIYREADGAWVLDEKTPWGCIGNCEESWNQLSQQLALSTPSAAIQEATPEGDADWMSWLRPEECMADPMSQEEYAAILSKVPDTANRSYTVEGPAPPESAEGAVQAARSYEACSDYGLEDQRRGSETDARIFYRTANMNWPLSEADFQREQLEKYRQISAQLQTLTPEDFMVVTDNEPPEDVLAIWGKSSRGPAPMASNRIYNPTLAVSLEDDRVLIPQTDMSWFRTPELAAQYATPPSDQYVGGWVTILKNVDGEWKVDEQLTVCIGECSDFWASFEQSAAPLSTPEASPVTETDWLAWMTPEECAVEPISQEAYAEIMRNEPKWPSREYTIVGVPDQDMVHAAATVAREHEICDSFRMTDQKRALESPSYIYVSNNGFVADTSPQEQRLQLTQHSRELSAQLPIQDPLHYIAVSEREGDQTPELLGNFYLPENGFLLSDGRIVIPATKVFANNPENVYLPGGMIILSNESGKWLVDEALNLCVGDCDDYWAESMATTVGPTASPAATPEDQRNSLNPDAVTESIQVDLDGVPSGDEAALADPRDTLHTILDPYGQGQSCHIGFVNIASRAPDIQQGVEISARIGQMIEAEFPQLLPEPPTGGQPQLASESIALPDTSPTGEVQLQLFLDSGCEPAP